MGYLKVNVYLLLNGCWRWDFYVIGVDVKRFMSFTSVNGSWSNACGLRKDFSIYYEVMSYFNAYMMRSILALYFCTLKIFLEKFMYSYLSFINKKSYLTSCASNYCLKNSKYVFFCSVINYFP